MAKVVSTKEELLKLSARDFSLFVADILGCAKYTEHILNEDISGRVAVLWRELEDVKTDITGLSAGHARLLWCTLQDIMGIKRSPLSVDSPVVERNIPAEVKIGGLVEERKRSVHVSHFPPQTTRQDLKDVFSIVAPVVDVVQPSMKKYAFIIFETPESVTRCLQHGPYIVHNCELTVEARAQKSATKPVTPSRAPHPGPIMRPVPKAVNSLDDLEYDRGTDKSQRRLWEPEQDSHHIPVTNGPRRAYLGSRRS
eukprot:Colp12_sorted_trinity150504_noHs@29072